MILGACIAWADAFAGKPCSYSTSSVTNAVFTSTL